VRQDENAHLFYVGGRKTIPPYLLSHLKGKPDGCVTEYVCVVFFVLDLHFNLLFLRTAEWLGELPG
jgi:hypothetical protein